MVLTQRDGAVRTPVEHRPFPYHYGSYATKRFKAAPAAQHVRFHTTMVLTQRYYLSDHQPAEPQFPYHYGSYATQ